MLTLLHASDLHFGKPHRHDAADALLASVEEADPDGIVVSGDLTQRAKVREYVAARAYLERLPEVPVVVTPGNHDVPLYRIFERIFAPYRNYKKYISPELDTVTRIPGKEGGAGAVVVALNSAAPRRRIVNGRILPGQLDFARRSFAESDPEWIRILTTHHHLAPAPDYEDESTLPKGAEILDACHEMGVEMILGGHLHRAYIGNSLDVHPGSDRDHGIVIVQSGTSTSHRGRAREQAKNSFNLIRIAEELLEITHHMYIDEIGRFRPFSAHLYPRRRDRYFSADPFRALRHRAVGEFE